MVTLKRLHFHLSGCVKNIKIIGLLMCNGQHILSCIYIYSCKCIFFRERFILIRNISDLSTRRT